MNITILSFGIIEYDGRLKELINVSNNIGETKVICCTSTIKEDTKKIKYVKVKDGKYLSLSTFFKFFYKSLKMYLTKGKIDILVVDNYFAAFVTKILMLIKKPNFIVQDVRELYFSEDMKTLKGKMLVKAEAELMKKSDIVLTANLFRSEILQKRYGLKNRPVVFENIRLLTGDTYHKRYSKKYSNYFKYSINIVSTGGVFLQRKTLKLIEAVGSLGNDFGLYIIGGGTKHEMDIVSQSLRENNIQNVHFIDKVPMEELKYIVQQCQIGIVNYHQDDLNNVYCASGKVYEYLGEGLPIVTTENIPLKDFCERNKVGVSDDGFGKGILEITQNYTYYLKNVDVLMNSISVNDYNKKISDTIFSIYINEKLT